MPNESLSGPEVNKAEARYAELSNDRLPFLQRARDCALYTIPSLIPPEGHNNSTKYYTPYQSIGARGVNNLASKMDLALLPPGAAFFRFRLSPQVEKDTQPEEKTAIEEALSLLEQKVLAEIEKRSARVHAFEAFKHLIVGGNALLHVPPKEGLRVFPLWKYVVKRTPEGEPIEIMVKEAVALSSLPQATRDLIKDREEFKKSECKDTDLYTWLVLEDDKWSIHQETCGVVLPDSKGTYPKDKCPWIPLRWTRIDGESYGRGLCEEYLGDLQANEGLSKAIFWASAQAAKVIWLVKPAGMTDPKEASEAESGDFIPGEEGDLYCVQMDKQADMAIAAQTLQSIDTRLAYAFLLNSAIQRNGERVTAEEIRTMASELEDALGGVYSILATEFQLPLVSIVKAQMERNNEFPDVKPKDAINLTIVTGIDALGRSHELVRLEAFIADIEQKFPGEAAKYINVSEYLSRRAAGLGIDTKGLIRTPEEVAQMDQIQKTQSLAEKVAPNATNAIGKSYLQAQQAQLQPQQQVA